MLQFVTLIGFQYFQFYSGVTVVCAVAPAVLLLSPAKLCGLSLRSLPSRSQGSVRNVAQGRSYSIL